MKTLPKSLEEFSFAQREKINGKTIKNRCGRDFLYYGLHYNFPEKFNSNKLNPFLIEQNKLFGYQLPSWLMWTQLQFAWLPKYLKENQLKLFINNREINSFRNFFFAILFSKINLNEALKNIETAVDEGRVAGIDIGLKYHGLFDHIMFVYGYDAGSLYILDTHKVPMLEYEKLSQGDKYFMKLPKEVVQKRWTRFGRVWELKRLY